MTSLVVRAPVRVMDLGGWTDTWFARSGLVCSIAVGPATTVELHAPGTAHDRWLTPDLPRAVDHPLLDAAAGLVGKTPGGASIRSLVPPGAGLGTSASVLVALLAGLSADGPPGGSDDPAGLARLAHLAETSTGAQSGVQDQVAAAYGGVLLIEVDYPHTRVARLPVSPEVRDALAERLLTVFFGRPHHSSDLHVRVIAELEGGDAEPLMAPLRAAARAGADALCAGDLDSYAEAIRANTAAQRALHSDLIGSDACWLEELCARFGATMKVNGAGGEGGSATVLLPADRDRAAALRSAIAATASWRLLQLVPVDTGVMVG